MILIKTALLTLLNHVHHRKSEKKNCSTLRNYLLPGYPHSRAGRQKRQKTTFLLPTESGRSTCTMAKPKLFSICRNYTSTFTQAEAEQTRRKIPDQHFLHPLKWYGLNRQKSIPSGCLRVPPHHQRQLFLQHNKLLNNFELTCRIGLRIHGICEYLSRNVSAFGTQLSTKCTTADPTCNVHSKRRI